MEILWGYLTVSLIYLGIRHLYGVSAATLDTSHNKELLRSLGLINKHQFPLGSDTNSIGNSAADSSSSDTWNIVFTQDGKGVNTRLKRDATALSYGSASIDKRMQDTTSRTGVKTIVNGNERVLDGVVSNRRKRGTKERPQNSWVSDLPLLIENDTSLAVLQYIEQLSNKTRGQRNCQADLTGVGNINGPIVSLLNRSISHEYYSSIFSPQVEAAVRTSNLLSNIFKTWEVPNGTLYNEYFYYSLVRALVASNTTVVGSTIAFDWKNFRSGNSDYFCPHVYRRKPHDRYSAGNSKLGFINLGVKNEGFELCSNQSWFKDMRFGSNTFLWKLNHSKNICKKYKDRTLTEDVQTHVVTLKEGRWFGPQFICQDGLPGQWVVSYSIPFYGCNQNDTYFFKWVKHYMQKFSVIASLFWS